MSARPMRAHAAIAAAIAATALSTHGRAGEPLTCQKPEVGSVEECKRVPKYRADFTQTLIPNNWIHATVRGFAHFTWNYGGTGTFREVPGAGLLLGIAPLDSQVLRISAGADFAVGPRPDSMRQEVSIEPRVRVSFGNFGKLAPILPVDVYVNGVFPYWTGYSRQGWGVGGGLSFRILNRFAAELGYESVRDPAVTAPTASAFMHRATALIGVDIVSMIPNRINHVAKPTQRQAQIDLRCVMLDTAAAQKQAAAPSYCDDVMKALADGEVQDDERATTAFLRHLAAKQPTLSERLAREDERLEGCRQTVMRQQRRCVDCTGTTIDAWPSYVMDPHQLAEALGCIPRPDGARLVCEPREAEEAKEFAAECGK